jgi:hypothetical protein
MEWIAKEATDEQLNASVGRILALKEKIGLLSLSKSPTDADFSRPEIGRLQWQIAERALTEAVGAHPSTTLNAAGTDISYVQVGGANPSLFLNEIGCPDWRHVDARHALDIDQLYPTVVVAAYVPSPKPVNQFSWSETEWEALRQLCAHRKCILYFFGNPLALRHLPGWTRQAHVVVAYQALPAFEHAAAQHLRGHLQAMGSLPVEVPDTSTSVL